LADEQRSRGFLPEADAHADDEDNGGRGGTSTIDGGRSIQDDSGDEFIGFDAFGKDAAAAAGGDADRPGSAGESSQGSGDQGSHTSASSRNSSRSSSSRRVGPPPCSSIGEGVNNDSAARQGHKRGRQAQRTEGRQTGQAFEQGSGRGSERESEPASMEEEPMEGAEEDVRKVLAVGSEGTRANARGALSQMLRASTKENDELARQTQNISSTNTATDQLKANTSSKDNGDGSITVASLAQASQHPVFDFPPASQNQQCLRDKSKRQKARHELDILEDLSEEEEFF